MPSLFQTGIVVSIYKAGDASIPGNFRPITLILHIRKVISFAVHIYVTQKYWFYPAQFGFTAGSSTELATVMASSFIREELSSLAVLDLRSTYLNTRPGFFQLLCRARLSTPV